MQQGKKVPPRDDNKSTIVKKKQLTINLDVPIIELIDQYQKDSLQSDRTAAIKDLLRFALHSKGYIKKY